MDDRFSRRTFLRYATAASLVTLSIPQGQGDEANKPGRAEPKPVLGKYKEAPMLAALVASGKLPQVEKRLPAVPFVRHVAKIGNYGGTLYDQAESPGGRFHFDGTLIVAAQETDNGGRVIRPHLCDSVSAAPDFRSFEFHIRQGLKWSDGVDLTTDDVLWWWWNEARNSTIFPEGPRTFKVGDNFAEFTRVDPLTFRIGFAEPFRPCLNLSASEYMAFGSYFGQPAHWMKQFHKDFNPDADNIARKNGFAAWYQYYLMVREYMHPVVNKPHVAPWVRVASTTTHDIYERNPYFFEVDQEGNQLPYIDRLFVQVVEDHRLQEARRATGSVSEGVCDMSQISIFTKNESRGHYAMRHWHLADSSECMFAFNLNHKDHVKRQIYNDLRFREALSYAIDRRRINQTLYFGQAKEWQATISPNVSYFDPEWISHCAQYDPAKAINLLDQVGLRRVADEPYRLGPDGNRFVSVVIFNKQNFPVELLEFVRQDWAQVGIEVIMKEADFRYREWVCRAGNQDCTCWNGDMVEEIAAYLPWVTKWNPQEVLFYAIDWWLWYYSRGKSGVKPPQDWIDQFDRMAAWYSAKSEEEYQRLGRAVWDFFSRQLVCIGTVGFAPQPVVIANGLQNVPEDVHMGYGTMWAKSYFVQTYFWDLPEKHA
jgi:peptide/nickel transport system substrate-binding protein